MRNIDTNTLHTALDLIKKLKTLQIGSNQINDLRIILKKTEQNIKDIIFCIQKQSSFEDTEQLFSLLEEYQYPLASLVFRSKLEVTSYLKEFVRNYDRLDDKELRIFLFEQLKAKHKI
jgi:anion-transporting  ArsA/GET3 family ATPase